MRTRDGMGRRSVMPLVMGVLLLLAACGDAGESPATASVETTTTTVADTTTTTSTTSTTQATTTSTTQATTTTTTATTTTTQATTDPTGGIAGVEVFDGLLVTHVEGDVEYDVIPPAGGSHAGTWVPCGPYEEEVPEEEAVHSLEHGAVWVTFDPAQVPDGAFEQLVAVIFDTLGGDQDLLDYVLLSPYPDMPAPVVASAWGRQLRLDGVDDARLGEFLLFFTNGPQTPEPGAPC